MKHAVRPAVGIVNSGSNAHPRAHSKSWMDILIVISRPNVNPFQDTLVRRTTVANALMMLGLLTGVAASVAWLGGFEPAPTAGWLVKVALYKLTFIASLSMLAAGAAIGRWNASSSTERAPESPGAPHQAQDDSALAEGNPQLLSHRQQQNVENTDSATGVYSERKSH